MSDIGVELERDHALLDTQAICQERGIDIIIRLRTEDEVVRDKYGSIKKRDTAYDEISCRAYPCNFNATDEQKRDAGLREETQTVIYTAMQDWIDNGYDLKRLNDIDLLRATVIVNEVTYEIKDKNLVSQFFDTFLYVTLGLNRR